MKDNVKIINMTRKFIDFYNATHHNMDAVEIYNIWKEKYGFAAVPPGDQGQKIVLDSLFKVYPNYAKAIQTIETFTPDESTIYDTLTQVKSCLGFHESIDLVVIYFVGFFENNAFVAPYDENTLALCLPIENDSKPLEQKMVLVHELTHIVHAKTSNSNGDWIRPVVKNPIQILCVGFNLIWTMMIQKQYLNLRWARVQPIILEKHTMLGGNFLILY